jgi:hypothetical protein
MNEPRQFQFYQIGMYGCNYLTLVHYAEDVTGVYIDAYQNYLSLIRAGLMRADCYLFDHDPIMNSLTWGKKWKSSLETANYVAQPGELVVQHWVWQKDPLPAAPHEHYKAPDYDPFGTSETCKFGHGHIEDMRVYRRIT